VISEQGRDSVLSRSTEEGVKRAKRGEQSEGGGVVSNEQWGRNVLGGDGGRREKDRLIKRPCTLL
jgi:hypothetical protein